MRKVNCNLFITVDGVVEAPEKWSFDSFDQAMGEEMGKTLGNTDTILMGSKTYQEWVNFWPHQANDPFADFINHVPKHVFSKSLNDLTWQHSTLVNGDLAAEVKRLKALPGKDIGTAGSPSLVYSLLQANLVDELVLMFYPVIAGHGKRLFPNDGTLQRLQLTRSRITPSGVALHVYEPRSNS